MQVWSLAGITPYEEAQVLSHALVDLRARDLVPDTLLLLEHAPVVTRGRGLQIRSAMPTGKLPDIGGLSAPQAVHGMRHVPLPGPLPAGVAFAESERGGDLTYHGPGQLVAYPIFKLDGQGAHAPKHDVGGFLRRFEGAFSALVEKWSEGRARAFSREGAAGVWVCAPSDTSHDASPRKLAPLDASPRKIAPLDTSPRKIASMGIAVRRWVTYHGLAINCVNDLRPFQLFSPCGFDSDVMTRLRDWVAPDRDLARALRDWDGEGRARIEADVAAQFGHAGVLERRPVSELLARVTHLASAAEAPAESRS